MKKQFDDTFLAKWLNKELDAETLTKFEKSQAFKEYSQIINTLNTATIPAYNVEKNLKATLQKIKEQKTTKEKVRRLIPYWAYAAASCLVLAFFGYLYFFQQTTYSTSFAEQRSFELPDKSKVQLNAGSEITFKTYGWKNDRKINLKGEAFFKVQKGTSFTVNTTQGEVEVLGTSFTVKDRKNHFQVTCFTGKVSVKTIQKEKVILTKGQAYLLQNNKEKKYQIAVENPSWINNQSTFTAVDIKEVINEIERQYNITIKGKENLKSANFSGRFTHNNLNKAIKTVFKAMEIPYKVDKNGNLEIKKY